MAIPNSVVKFGFERAGAYFGGPVGAALGSMAATSAFMTAEFENLGQKFAEGRAQQSDVYAATAAMEAAILAGWGGAAAMGFMAGPGILITAAVIVGGAAALHLRNPQATFDAVDAFSDAWGEQPWTIIERTAGAYSAAIQRQKEIDAQCRVHWSAACSWVARDPLILDLDADGIEATAINTSNPILFDQDADGIRTATGWIKADDGIVVLDINGNGTIDSGRELFGDNTLLANGTKAANGYQALAQYDANADGKISAADAIYTQLRVWQDANQDGASQSGELRTLAQLGIASIGVTGQASTITLGNDSKQFGSLLFTSYSR